MTIRSLPTIAQLLNSKWRQTKMPPMLYMTDEARTPNLIKDINKLARGSGVIFRHYNAKSRLELGIKVKKACRKKGCLFIVAGDAALAVKLNADGLHLPEHLVLNPSLKATLWRLRPNKILTASAHCQKTLLKCRSLTIHAALLSPVFPTKSHPNQASLGVAMFQKLVKQQQFPIYALGGINNGNAIQLINCPAIGIAGIRAFL